MANARLPAHREGTNRGGDKPGSHKQGRNSPPLYGIRIWRKEQITVKNIRIILIAQKVYMPVILLSISSSCRDFLGTGKSISALLFLSGKSDQKSLRPVIYGVQKSTHPAVFLTEPVSDKFPKIYLFRFRC